MVEFERRWERCPCLSHRLSREWYGVTGDSYNTHVVPVIGAMTAGSYMAKYLDKAFMARRELEKLGVLRRWSTSRGWPGGGRLQLKQSEGAGGPGWSKRVMRPLASSVEVGGPDELMERFGEDLTLALSEKAKQRKGFREMERMVRHVN